MGLTAKDVMTTDFDTIRPEASVVDAVKMTFKGKMRSSGHRTASLMVIDQYGQLVGSISMFDVLYHFRPNILHLEMDGITDWIGQLEPYRRQFAGLAVEQVMNRTVITVKPDDHLMVIIDTMIKKGVRRLPVIQNSKVVGIVFFPDVYYYLFKNWIDAK